MSTATDPLYDERTAFLDRIRTASGTDGLSRAEALHATLRVAGANLGWHEAEAVAEALRHRYDGLVHTSVWLRAREWNDPATLAAVRKDMRRELVLTADADGTALVDEPVEWRYAEPDSPLLGRRGQPPSDVRGRTPLTAAQVAALPDIYYVLVKLVGHTQRLDR